MREEGEGRRHINSITITESENMLSWMGPQILLQEQLIYSILSQK